MRNLYSIIPIVGLTLALMSLIATIVLSVIFLKATYPLHFEDANGHPIDGTVYINNEYIGKTFQGTVYTEHFRAGEVKFIVKEGENEYEQYFLIEPRDEIYELTLVVEPIDPSDYEIKGVNFSDYLDAVNFDDPNLRIEAINSSKECPSGDKECQIISIFEHVLAEYKYYGDPRYDEIIQKPEDTKRYMGGDCEDLSILLNSLLENVGIETWMVFTEDHAYSLVCGVDLDIMHWYTVILFTSTYMIDNVTEEIFLRPGQTWYYGGDKSYPGNLYTYYGEVRSGKPIVIFAVDNIEDYWNFMDGIYYRKVQDSYVENVNVHNFVYEVNDQGGLVIYNPNKQSTTVLVSSEVYASQLNIDPNDIEIRYYELLNQTCIPLDPSGGAYAYAGWESPDITKKVFVNTLTGDVYASE